ncbi:MAG: SRPBCC domain-containing protein [Bacteroidota bacterium]
MTRLFIILAYAAISMSCLSGQNSTDSIQWPTEYHPSISQFFVHNEIEIKATPATVWGHLIDALKWPQWYKGAQKVTLSPPTDTLLQANAVFNWKTMGLKFQSTILQFDPYRLLAWESKKPSIRGYHVWWIVPTANGCRVITEELQNGWLTFFEKTFQGKKLERLHALWLQELKTKSEH